tara:strand:+ start:4818 stop:6239 length:1422 start_codon:yes stop_codon:yes gene_type:complete
MYNCEWCDKVFERKAHERYCDRPCKRTAMSVKRKPFAKIFFILCKGCNNLITTENENKKYHNTDCYDAYRRVVRYDKKCNECNKIFMPVYKTDKYCGKECRKLGYKKIRATNKKTYEITCKFCKKKSIKRRKRKYCDTKCYNSWRHRTIMFICLYCETENKVAYRFRRQKFCDQKCMGKYASMITKHETKCKYCGIIFIQSKYKQYQKQYCEYECFVFSIRGGCSATIILTCKNENCHLENKEFEVEYIKRNRQFCGKSCATSGKNNPMYGKPGTQLGKPAWNKGLTKETDERLAKLGKKISKILKAKFESGELSHEGENNPMYNRTRETMTLEQLKNYSNAAIKQIQDGKTLGFKSGKKGWYTSTKTDNRMFYRSSYELRAMIYFDECDDVIDYKHEPYSIPYGKNNEKNYLFDFIVYFKNNITKIIEIKARYFLKIDKIIIREKAIAAKKYCDENNMKYEIWTGAKLDLLT